MQERLEHASRAAAQLLSVGIEVKNAALMRIAQKLEESREEIARAYQRDLAQAQASGLPAPLLKRLVFDDKKLADVLAGIRDLLAMPDPVGRVLEARLLDDGLVLR